MRMRKWNCEIGVRQRRPCRGEQRLDRNPYGVYLTLFNIHPHCTEGCIIDCLCCSLVEWSLPVSRASRPCKLVMISSKDHFTWSSCRQRGRIRINVVQTTVP